CLEKEPARRYGSAADLSADLGRFLRGEPIHARTAGWREHAWKWARRRPVVAASVAISGAAVVGLLIGWVWFTLGVQRERDRADGREREAIEQRRRAESGRDRALETIDRFLGRIGNEKLTNVPGMDVIRRDMVQDAVDLQQALQRDLNEDPVVRRHI